ncbi:ECF transporter S component [Anaerocellum danielii]|uniref:ECF transporter S component n=1 Tax=Anaerocellum danielii TaxID=1387557 RepID=A0ABZ0TXE9_9FIRM|nr:ECF transporter S component [Caldicellulosiruptor danielii]WPX07924.1 ECF transporter S component [Caldicellulosiruptor danielii]
MKNGVRFWVFSGIMIALVFVLTFTIKIPLLAGYFNIGDVIIMISSILFGKSIGFMSGSFGSALADIASGYTIYAPFTFIIKGLEGFICGLIFEKLEPKQKKWVSFILSTVSSGIFMAAGYFLSEASVLKYLSSALNINRDLQFGLKVALANLPFNLLQGILSAIISVILVVPLYNNKFIGKMRT